MCEHVGSLFEYIDRHYNHSNSTYPLAHNLVTSYYLSGAVRFPIDFEDTPHIKVKDLLPLIPKSAFSPIQVGSHIYWCFTFCCRVLSFGKLRLVGHFFFRQSATLK